MGATQYLRKAEYLARQSVRRFKRSAGCPNCGHAQFLTIDRKGWIVELRDCARCRLMYRFPTDPQIESVEYYQKEYAQGFTTEMPEDSELARLTKSRFAGHEKDYAPILSLLADLGVAAGGRLFDFGCSWGYGSWQFAEAGYDVKSFEISRARARFSRDKLGVDCIDDLSALAGSCELFNTCDVFFSNHVLEHVPSPSVVVATARKLLKRGGLFVAITPNGSLDYREISRRAWHQSWGKVHPNLLSDTFWAREFTREPHFIGSLPESRGCFADWAIVPDRMHGQQTGNELVCVAQL